MDEWRSIGSNNAKVRPIVKSGQYLFKYYYYILVYRILGDIPNTYAFTKALGEALVADEMEKLPIIIVRPSIGKFLMPQTNLCLIFVNGVVEIS